MEWNLNSKMPFGKYKGVKLLDLDRNYIIWLCTRDWFKGDLKKFMVENEHNFKMYSLNNSIGDMMSNSLYKDYV